MALISIPLLIVPLILDADPDPAPRCPMPRARTTVEERRFSAA